MLSNQELRDLLTDMESDRVERKASLSDRDRIREAICAFGNDLPDRGKPGVVFVGANDDGTCADLPITDQLLLTLADMRSDGNILPIPVMTVEKAVVDGCELAVVQVEPSRLPPLRYRGRVWIRVGPRRAIATAEEELVPTRAAYDGIIVVTYEVSVRIELNNVVVRAAIDQEIVVVGFDLDEIVAITAVKLGIVPGASDLNVIITRVSEKHVDVVDAVAVIIAAVII